MQQALNIVQVVAFLGAFVALASRLFVASRPFWSRLPAFYQTLLPALVPALATFAQALTGVKTWGDLWVQFMVCAAMLLPGLPSNRSAAPMQASKPVSGTPSAGDVAVAKAMSSGAVQTPPGPKPPSIPPLAAAGLFALCFVLGGCALFESKLPDAERCLPTPASLAAQVADILAAGGDTTTALEQLAITQGEQAVICAVKAFLSKPAASPTDSPERDRARAYLAAKGVK